MSDRDLGIDPPAKTMNVEVVRSFERRSAHLLVQVRTSDEVFNLAWQSAVQALRERIAAVLSAAETPIRASVSTALDALAVGDFAASRQVLIQVGNARFAQQDDWLYLLLVARYFAATGDIGRTRAEWPRVKVLLAELPVNASLLRELADTAASIGERNDQSQLLEAARRDVTNDPSIDPFMRLMRPVWNDASGSKSGFENRDDGIRSMIHGLIGFTPDASRNRVQLRPAIPSDWSSLEIDNLRCGDGTLGLHYRRDGDKHRYCLLPGSGAVPLRVVFEPQVQANRVSAVLLDSQPATLDLRRNGDGWVCPVQIDLDAERTIVVDTTAANE
jgi:hypothetical protein